MIISERTAVFLRIYLGEVEKISDPLNNMARLNIHDQSAWSRIAAQSEYQAAQFANNIGVSRRQLYRYTMAAFGHRPQQWLNILRLTKAAPLLKKRRSAKQVASELGFKQLSHFSREFKLFYGVPPTVFLDRVDRL
jgi:AraC-like DNA-binding protein